jgi:hypothetical protein
VTPDVAGVWRLLPPSPLSASVGYAHAWTGSQLLIQGFTFDPQTGTPKTYGTAYTPATRLWRKLPASPYPIDLVEGRHWAVWTGTEMLTFGGGSSAAYNPATGRWRQLTGGPAGPSVVVWTGQQILVWGGGCCGSNSAEGSAYDPVTGKWTALPPAPLSGRHAEGGVWTGRELLIIGGTNDDGVLADGAAYNPATRTWRTIAALPKPTFGAAIVWTGVEMLAIGGRSYQRPAQVYRDAYAYSPVTNRWRRLPDMDLPRFHHMAVWTGKRLLVWGGSTSPFDERTGTFATPAHGVSYDPATQRWEALPSSPLRGRTEAVAVWTGDEMLIWGGFARDGRTLADGAAYRPTTP